MKKQYVIKLRPLLVCILIPLIVGGLAGFITRNMEAYKSLEKPALTPPGAVFPVVWTVLYILMGLSSYLIYISKSPDRKQALRVYALQLALNFLWPIVFFGLQLYLLSFAVILMLWVAIFFMIRLFCNIRRLAAYLNIPYLLWVAFAAYLNLGIYYLNR